MESGRKRKRGIRASKIKLAEALNACRLSTQIALAEKMADLEGTDLVPKDLVNRAFREQPIEFTNLARIASALGVETHTLFLVEEAESKELVDSSLPELVSQTKNLRSYNSSNNPGNSFRAYYVASGLIFMGALFLVPALLSFYKQEQSASPWHAIEPKRNQFAFVLVAEPGELEQILVESLNKKLKSHYNLSSPAVANVTRTNNPELVTEQLGADGVVTLRVLQGGRLTALQYFFYANKIQQAFHVDFYTADEIRQAAEYITAQSAEKFRALIEHQHFAAPPSLHAQREYLEGMELLDAPYSDFAYSKAQLHFRNALSQDAEFVEAHAGLCLVLADASWNGDSAEMLQQAKLHCEKAFELEKSNLRVQLAMGNLQLKSGDSEAAKAWFMQTFTHFPENNAGHEGLATVAMQELVATGEHDAFLRGEHHSQLALAYAPDSWGAHFIYGNLLFYHGKITEALPQWQQAATLRPHEVLFNNIGIASFCMNHLDIAEQSFRSTQQFNQASYIGDEALGKLQYYRGNFSLAAELQKSALAKIGDDANIHQMWAALADSLRQTGNQAAAVEAYRKALEIIEKDLLIGIAEYGNTLHRQYYLLRMKELDPEAVADVTMQSLEIDSAIADGDNLSASELIKLAQLYAIAGDTHKADRIWGRAAQVCPVYSHNPELVQLLGERL